MQALFGRNDGAAGAGAATNRTPFVTIKAGQIASRPVEGSDPPALRLEPSAAKGQIELARGNEGAMHLRWRNRATNTVGLDMMVFPNEVSFTKISAPDEKDRVYKLEFTGNSSRRMFFWMQSPKDDKDEELAKKLIDTINDPPADAPGASAAAGAGGHALSQLLASGIAGGAGGSGGGGGGRLTQQVSSLPPQLQQAMLSQLAGGVGAGAGGDTGGADMGADEDEDDELQRALALSMMDGGGAPAPAPADEEQSSGAGEAAAPPAGAEEQQEDESGQTGGEDGDAAGAEAAPAVATPAAAPSEAVAPAAGAGGSLTMEDFMRAMGSLMTGNRSNTTPLAAILTSAEVGASIVGDEEAEAKLLPLLPDGQRTREHLREVLSSPQLQQAMRSLSGALDTGNAESVFANFNLQPADGEADMARGDGVGAFLSALQAQVDRNKSQQGGSGDGADGSGADA